MKPLKHVAVSVSCSLILYAAFQKISVVIGCIIAGVLIDIDHFFDLYMMRRKWSGLKEAYRICADYKLEHVYVFFHSIEAGLILVALVLAEGFPPFLTGVAVGYNVHIICDKYANHISKYGYFLIYRIITRFSPEKYYLDVQEFQRENKKTFTE